MFEEINVNGKIKEYLGKEYSEREGVKNGESVLGYAIGRIA